MNRISRTLVVMIVFQCQDFVRNCNGRAFAYANDIWPRMPQSKAYNYLPLFSISQDARLRFPRYFSECHGFFRIFTEKERLGLIDLGFPRHPLRELTVTWSGSSLSVMSYGEAIGAVIAAPRTCLELEERLFDFLGYDGIVLDRNGDNILVVSSRLNLFRLIYKHSQ